MYRDKEKEEVLHIGQSRILEKGKMLMRESGIHAPRAPSSASLRGSMRRRLAPSSRAALGGRNRHAAIPAYLLSFLKSSHPK